MDNPAAFPSRKDEPMVGGGSYRNDAPGMTLRDWFAGQALSGVIAATSAGQHRPGKSEPGEHIRFAIARDSYDMADAMLAARTQSIREGVDRD